MQTLFLGPNWRMPQYKIICLYKYINTMAKNGKVGDGHRNGAVDSRSQVNNPKTDLFVKRNTDNGQFMDVKTSGGKFKGVTTEKK
jgi:hypothetical protein